MVEITKCCVKQVTHPGINYFVKHVGSIFRRLFQLAIEGIETFVSLQDDVVKKKM